MITQSKLLEMFDYRPDGNLIHRYTVQGGKRLGEVAGSPHNMGYRQITISRKKYLMHRLIWCYHYDEIPDQLDHINGERSDNRIENLRECSYSQNHGNKRMNRNNTSGYKGVFLNKQGNFWFVYVANKYIGRSNSIEEAAAIYDKAAKAHFGEFALTNNQLGLL